jgi:hypothetical protein
MRAGPFSLAACVVSAALLFAACSSSGKQSTPTTANVTATTTTNPAAGFSYPAPVQRPRAVAKLGSCPEQLPYSLFTAMTPHVDGLATELVPIVTLSMRVCRYGGNAQRLLGHAVLEGLAAKRVAAETNKLMPRRLPGLTPVAGPADTEFFLTFANHSQQVAVVVNGPFPTNGTFVALPPPPRWLDELTGYSTTQSKSS